MDRISAVFCSHFLVLGANSLPYNSFISYIQRQFLAIHSTHLDSCVNTVGDTISMQVEPWFSHEVGKDFRKRENGGVFTISSLLENGLNSFLDLGRCKSKLVA